MFIRNLLFQTRLYNLLKELFAFESLLSISSVIVSTSLLSRTLVSTRPAMESRVIPSHWGIKRFTIVMVHGYGDGVVKIL